MSLNIAISRPSGINGAVATKTARPDLTVSRPASATDSSHEAAWVDEMLFVFDEILRFGLSPSDLATPGPRFPVAERFQAASHPLPGVSEDAI